MLVVCVLLRAAVIVWCAVGVPTRVIVRMRLAHRLTRPRMLVVMRWRGVIHVSRSSRIGPDLTRMLVVMVW